MVNLRRPADVLAVMSRGSSGARTEKTAIDIKVINALGQGHFVATTRNGVAAAESYRDTQMQHLNTASLCRERRICYEPVVFTTQGGVEGHAEAILSRIATAVAANEDAEAAEVKAEMLQTISLSLARSVAKAVRRRRPTASGSLQGGGRRQAVETAVLEPEGGFQLQ